MLHSSADLDLFVTDCKSGDIFCFLCVIWGFHFLLNSLEDIQILITFLAYLSAFEKLPSNF